MPIVTTDIRGVPRPIGSAYDEGAHEGDGGTNVLPSPIPSPTAAFIPAGSLAFSGFADSPMKFYSPDGVDLGIPPSAPSLQGDRSGCTGLIQVNGHYFATGNVGSVGTVAYDSQLATIIGSTVARTFDAAGDYATHVYSMNVAVGNYEVWQFLDGVKIAAFNVGATHFPTSPTLGMKSDGTIAYHGLVGNDTIYKVVLSGPTRSTFVTETGFKLNQSTILVLPDGEVIAGWHQASGNGFIRRYSAAGATIATYAIAGINATPFHLTPGISPSETFWVNYHSNSDTWSQAVVAEIRITEGAVLHSFAPNNGQFEFDGPFCVVRVNIGVPVIVPPPSGAPGGGGGSVAIPVIQCQPQTIISTPSRASGCDQGGTGFTLSYTGPSGSVPIGANPIDGMLLTGQRTSYI